MGEEDAAAADATRKEYLAAAADGSVRRIQGDPSYGAIMPQAEDNTWDALKKKRLAEMKVRARARARVSITLILAFTLTLTLTLTLSLTLTLTLTPTRTRWATGTVTRRARGAPSSRSAATSST